MTSRRIRWIGRNDNTAPDVTRFTEERSSCFPRLSGLTQWPFGRWNTHHMEEGLAELVSGDRQIALEFGHSSRQERIGGEGYFERWHFPGIPVIAGRSNEFLRKNLRPVDVSIADPHRNTWAGTDAATEADRSDEVGVPRYKPVSSSSQYRPLLRCSNRRKAEAG